MTSEKRTVLGVILFILAVITICSCIIAFGARRREPERAKLVMIAHETTGEGFAYGR